MKRRHIIPWRLAGFAWMAVAVLIWASWLVLTSSGRTTALSVLDLAVLRAIVPALILAPLLWRHRQEIVRVGPLPCLFLSAYGAPFILCVGLGLSYAPVAHAGALVPGLMPVVALALGLAGLGRRPDMRQGVAVLLIVTGAAAIVLQGAGGEGSDQRWVGHMLFLLGALCWASFTVTMQVVALPPFLATAIVGAVSALVLLPIWAISDLSNLGAAQFTDIAFQVVFQGVISGLLSMFAFSRALALIPDMAPPLSALTPGVAAILAIPVLGQIPGIFDVLALALVVAGLAANASGATRLPEAVPPTTTRRVAHAERNPC